MNYALIKPLQYFYKLLLTMLPQYESLNQAILLKSSLQH